MSSASRLPKLVEIEQRNIWTCNTITLDSTKVARYVAEKLRFSKSLVPLLRKFGIKEVIQNVSGIQ